MAIPVKSAPVWRQVITSSDERHLSNLATKLVLQRLRQTVHKDPSQLSGAADELYDFVQSHAFAHAAFES